VAEAATKHLNQRTLGDLGFAVEEIGITSSNPSNRPRPLPSKTPRAKYFSV
jgi:hypothetical protein